MLTKKQVQDIRDHLEKAQNPVFFFDNDQDGLCSFLLFQRYIERGRGVPIKSFPELDETYFRKVKELEADYIFILDKPLVSDKFWKEVEQVNLPVVWIDHHEMQGMKDSQEIPEFVNYYNPLYNEEKTNEPVSALCYQVTQKKEDLWIAFVGSISDKFIPDFYPEFKKKYPELDIEAKDAFDLVYKAEVGKIIKLFGAGLKDRTSNVIAMLRFLMKVKTPFEVLEENSSNYLMHKRFNQIEEKYSKLIKEAVSKNSGAEKLLFFRYAGDMSVSSELSNELGYMFPEKYIFVMYTKGDKANISGRGLNVRKILLEAIKDIDGATGGGHENAIGAQMRVGDLEAFKEKLDEIIK